MAVKSVISLITTRFPSLMFQNSKSPLTKLLKDPTRRMRFGAEVSTIRGGRPRWLDDSCCYIGVGAVLRHQHSFGEERRHFSAVQTLTYSRAAIAHLLLS
jgi:hypothetical protein